MKILLIDDHALFRDGMRYVLKQLSEEVEILEADNLHDGMELAKLHPELDLALLDLNMPGSKGPSSIKHFHQRYPHIPVVVVSGEENSNIISKAINYGAMGFVCKNTAAPMILNALNLILSGGIYIPPQILQYSATDKKEAEPNGHLDGRANEYNLTSRQMQVLEHLAAGLSNKEIAEATKLAEGTVKVHLAAVYQNLHVSNRIEAILMAEKLGLVGAIRD
ncbi:MAG: response regulator transcription factor [Gallionellaceae bacterium]|jgi:DNA-binding NarL/FixJ family response regulator|nr:response regulator transcription factor [Gallionellaceae bacterium]